MREGELGEGVLGAQWAEGEGWDGPGVASGERYDCDGLEGVNCGNGMSDQKGQGDERGTRSWFSRKFWR